MNQQSFGSAEELAVFVTDQVIAYADIVTIIVRDSRWYLFWF